MQELLSELEATRLKTRVAEKRIEELEAVLKNGKSAADALGFDEASTRSRIINYELVTAGWAVAARPCPAVTPTP